MSMSIKKLFSTKKAVVVGASVALTLGLSGAAFAYFTSSGAGTGPAAVGTSTAIILSNTVNTTSMYPGSGAVWVPVSITNPGTGNEYVGTITGVVQDQVNTTQTGTPTCLGSWFTVAPITFNASVPAGATVASGGTAMLMNESGTNQDACQGLTLTINWTSN